MGYSCTTVVPYLSRRPRFFLNIMCCKPRNILFLLENISKLSLSCCCWCCEKILKTWYSTKIGCRHPIIQQRIYWLKKCQCNKMLCISFNQSATNYTSSFFFFMSLMFCPQNCIRFSPTWPSVWESNKETSVHRGGGRSSKRAKRMISQHDQILSPEFSLMPPGHCFMVPLRDTNCYCKSVTPSKHWY